MAKRGLGKGLDALIPDYVESEKKEESIVKNAVADGAHQEVYVDINKIQPNRDQPRKNFNEEALENLAGSIKQHGLITPILVQDRDTYYEIVAGERRWRASKKAGLKEVPVIIRKFTEQEILEIALIENIQREDLNPIEEALAYKKLMTEFNLKQEEVADKVNKSRTAVANSIRLLKLCDNVQKMVIEGDLTTGHARALLGIEDPNEQYRVALKVYNDKMSVRDIENLIKNMNKPAKEKKKINESLKAIYEQNEESLKQYLGTKVSISSKDDNGAGKIEIEFYSHDDFDRLIGVLKGESFE